MKRTHIVLLIVLMLLLCGCEEQNPSIIIKKTTTTSSINIYTNNCTLTSGFCAIVEPKITTTSTVNCGDHSGSVAVNLGTYRYTLASGIGFNITSSNILETSIVRCIIAN